MTGIYLHVGLLNISGVPVPVLGSFGEMLAGGKAERGHVGRPPAWREAGEEHGLRMRAAPFGPWKGQRTVSRDAANPCLKWQRGQARQTHGLSASWSAITRIS